MKRKRGHVECERVERDRVERDRVESWLDEHDKQNNYRWHVSNADLAVHWLIEENKQLREMFGHLQREVQNTHNLSMMLHVHALNKITAQFDVLQIMHAWHGWYQEQLRTMQERMQELKEQVPKCNYAAVMCQNTCDKK
jgi:hypothetical protein